MTAAKSFAPKRSTESTKIAMNESNNPNSPAQSTRRDFLKTSTAVVGGTLLSGLAIERSAHAAGGDTLKIALIGCGGGGGGAAGPDLTRTARVQRSAAGESAGETLGVR